jgi:hypothetical protein
MSLVWATRGRTWGFTFLRNESSEEDPLPVYDAAFSGLDDEPEAWQRVATARGRPEMVALRFPDPEARQDQAGRVIPHEFVVFGTVAEQIDSVETGRRLVWPLVADEFERIWEQPTPSSTDG